MRDDPVARRAQEIRAKWLRDKEHETARDRDLRAERLRVVTLYLDQLARECRYTVECFEAEQGPHSAVARFAYRRGDEVANCDLFLFGIDQVEGMESARRYGYFLTPSAAAAGVPNPADGLVRPLANTELRTVLDYAVAISIELLAQAIATGAAVGRFADFQSELDREREAAKVQQEQWDREQRAARRRERKEQGRAGWRRLWHGCLLTLLWIFGVAFTIGILGNVLESCSERGTSKQSEAMR